MFQNFDFIEQIDRTERLKALRLHIKMQNLDGYIIPRTDLYQNEFIEPADSRLEWISGFTGSAGLCIVMLENAYIFVDGRYELQIQTEVQTEIFQPIHTATQTIKQWLIHNCSGKKIGYDPWLHTVSEISALVSQVSVPPQLIQCKNLIDSIWLSRPRRKPLFIEKHPIRFSGISTEYKRKKLSKSLKSNGIDAVIITKPESICWLLNIRGRDVPHTPLVQSLAIMYHDSRVDLFLRETNISQNILKFLGPNLKIYDETSFLEITKKLINKKIQIDPTTLPIAIYRELKNNSQEIIKAVDPCILPKSIKNTIEIKGSKAAHILDGSAFANFLHWFDTFKDKSSLDEIQIVKKLEKFRHATGFLKEISFDSICGSGAHGAIVHYRVNFKTNRKILPTDLLLIDSGGQYKNGTTDITRTIAVGKPTELMIDCFTRVLKGLIAISELQWPEGLAGKDIDSLARVALWAEGLNYDHGTGHGIGSYLSVHEGPQGISKNNEVPLQSGMLISNEPGYYKADEFGVRIENVLLIKDSIMKKNKKNKMLQFETLTLAPIDKNLINVQLLNSSEKHWLNSYHKMVKDKIAPLVSQSVRLWLIKMCKPI